MSASSAPDLRIRQFADDLRACLDSADADAALIAFRGEMGRAVTLPRPANFLGSGPPHALAGMAAMLVAGALNRAGLSAEVEPVLASIAAPFAADWHVHGPEAGIRSLLGHFHFLWAPRIEAALARRDQDALVGMLVACKEERRHVGAAHWAFQDPLVAALTQHSRVAAYGPFELEPGWLLDRQGRALALGLLDHRRELVQVFEAQFLDTVLDAAEPARALPLVEARLGLYLDPAVPGRGEFGFLAACVLAALGRSDAAIAAARALARRGYHQLWRFDPGKAEATHWRPWLGPLAELPVYQAFLREDVIGRHLDGQDPEAMPLSAVRDGIWGGKRQQRCILSRAPILPGDPVVRMRRLFAANPSGDLDIAAAPAFAASGWQRAREQFDGDCIPVPLLFPPPARLRDYWDDPAVAAFHYDVAKDPRSLDIGRAVALLADHAPPPIRRHWIRGTSSADRWPAFAPWAGDDGHGDPVNLAWRLIRAGSRSAMLQRAAVLPQEMADKLLAIFAVFDDAALRDAAASHFGLPELPAIMALAFRDRLAVEDHLTLAGFADAHPRFRAAIVAAMRAHALHLYSNYHPGANWFLQGLEHVTRGHGCQLLFFLIHHPEDDEVLATMLEKTWLPEGDPIGAFDAYANARPFYLRTALFHLALHAPERLEAWLALGWIRERCRMAKDRDTFRLIEQLRGKRGPRRPTPPRSPPSARRSRNRSTPG